MTLAVLHRHPAGILVALFGCSPMPSDRAILRCKPVDDCSVAIIEPLAASSRAWNGLNPSPQATLFWTIREPHPNCLTFDRRKKSPHMAEMFVATAIIVAAHLFDRSLIA
jgi:hypothetical protein